MKKKCAIIALFLVVIMSLSFVLAACDKGGDESATPTDVTYVIQYTDDTGTYSIDVKPGEPYSMLAIPTREGYEFLGLFDAEVGGTQYVNAQGASLAPFTDNKNMVLFPQFKAKEYRLVLNYQGAPVTGEREIVVSYGSRIESLPTDLTLENKTFMGWYTEPNRGGLQVADQYGVIPEASIISPRNFDLSDPDGFIKLYAGFQGEMHSVTFYFEDGTVPEEMEIEHDTPIGNVVTETRVDGKAVLTWSREPNDEDRNAVFNGRVEGDMVLYALDYAPVIDFDANGGKKVSSIVASAGSAITLPIAQRENYRFAGWYTTSGTKYTATTMPTESVKLKAKWTPMLIFDERGGTLVEDIAAEQGTKVTLPTTEKDGYMFAGWYTEQGEVYTATAMPEFSTKLVAKYYKVLSKIVVLIDESTKLEAKYSTPSVDEYCQTLDLTDLYESGVSELFVTVHYKSSCYTNNSNDLTYMAWYSTQTASDAYKLWEYGESHKQSEVWQEVERSNTIKLSSPIIYISRYASNGSGPGWRFGGSWTDFWIEIEYPDMSQLY